VIAEMPRFRSQIAGSDLLEFPHADIGIAVGADDGLVVPVILAAEEKDLAELAAEAKRTVLRAREGRVDNMDQGVFTITNLGMFGIDEFTAIINPPEAAILAVSAIREAMIVRDGEALPGKVMSLTLSNDHRIIDGIVGARFMARLRELLEDPDQLLLRS
jgi:pyruvate dehydrogenase E2 component (dihydrolipoamide acetyltransferase)